ncbi:hypothetical protein BKA65DRAFT_217766 [Rhexocercosporidium sp. MPI-PUGE-AT-0058]|nr:hypothetical protein BKA65DRAFT_217766 [Rhexocercosporidium sp. MPI-PUGE-AT-0058]
MKGPSLLLVLVLDLPPYLPRYSERTCAILRIADVPTLSNRGTMLQYSVVVFPLGSPNEGRQAGRHPPSTMDDGMVRVPSPAVAMPDCQTGRHRQPTRMRTGPDSTQRQCATP